MDFAFEELIIELVSFKFFWCVCVWYIMNCFWLES